MNRYVPVVMLSAALLCLGFFSQTVHITNSTLVSKHLAIIVTGSDEFVTAGERSYNLTSFWEEYEILYLSSNLSLTPRADMVANRLNFPVGTGKLDERPCHFR
jgi:hypothetical protein